MWSRSAAALTDGQQGTIWFARCFHGFSTDPRPIRRLLSRILPWEMKRSDLLMRSRSEFDLRDARLRR